MRASWMPRSSRVRRLRVTWVIRSDRSIPMREPPGSTLVAHEPNWGFTAVPGRGRWWLRGSPYSTSVHLPLRVWLHDARPGLMAQSGSAAPAAGAAVALKTATAQGARHGALASAGRPSIHGPSTGVLLPDEPRPMPNIGLVASGSKTPVEGPWLDGRPALASAPCRAPWDVAVVSATAAPAAGAAVALTTATSQGARHGALASAGRPSIHGPSTGVVLPDATRPMFAT